MKNGEYNLVIAPDDYPGKKYRGKYCYEHHLVWWIATGELIEEGFLIHHKNENKRDNSFSNLEKKDNKKHVSEHTKERYSNRVPKHGTINEYTHHGCRCDECREINRIYAENRRKLKHS